MEAVQDAAAASEEDTIFNGESGANLRISIKDFPLLPLFRPLGFWEWFLVGIRMLLV